MAGNMNENLLEAALLLGDSFVECLPVSPPPSQPGWRSRKRKIEEQPSIGYRHEAEAVSPHSTNQWDNSMSSAAEALLQELEGNEVVPQNFLSASTDWGTRKRMATEKWKEARPQLVINSIDAKGVPYESCQKCPKKAVIYCKDCLPLGHLCEDCDCDAHSFWSLHNRQSLTMGFYQPISPSVVVVQDSEGIYSHGFQERVLPMKMPSKICTCSSSPALTPGREIVFINTNGRYDVALPELHCSSCSATWFPRVQDLQRSGYWPATASMASGTIFDVDVFSFFQELIRVSPGCSRLAVCRFLDEKTARHGRKGKVCSDTLYHSFMEWAISEHEVHQACKEEAFACPACTPDMLAVAVDGNRKLYRFNKPSSSSDPAYFDDAFICNDQRVAAAVKEMHSKTNHSGGKGHCGSAELLAAKECAKKSNKKLDEEGLEVAVCRHGILLRALNHYRGEIYAYPLILINEVALKRQVTFFCMDVTCRFVPYVKKVTNACPEYGHLNELKPFLSVMHAKAHDLKCEIKWGGRNQPGAGTTIGEEVEQANSFLSRLGMTTKYMSKSSRTDMITLQCKAWNETKTKQMGSTLSKRFRKTKENLAASRKHLEELQMEQALDQEQMKAWISDVQEWAQSGQVTTGSLQDLQSKLEQLQLYIKEKGSRLYQKTDTCKQRTKMRRKIRESKAKMESLLIQYNDLVEHTQQVNQSDVFTDNYVFPWQLTGTVDIFTKKKVFDSVMAVKRLEEEEVLLLKEMRQHWKYLRQRMGTLNNVKLENASNHGLTCLVKEKMFVLQQHMNEVKDLYKNIFDGVGGINEEEEFDVNISEDSETDSDEEQ